nr:MAG TPA: hypothetical protein [Caudoviricetes sp.]
MGSRRIDHADIWMNSRMMQHSTLLSQIHRTEKYMYRMS